MNQQAERDSVLESMSKAELKEEARSQGLSVHGTRMALLERLRAAPSEEEGGDQGRPDQGDATSPAPPERGGREPRTRTPRQRSTRPAGREPDSRLRRARPRAGPRDRGGPESRDRRREVRREDRGEEAPEEGSAAEGAAREGTNRSRPPLDEVVTGAAQALEALTGESVEVVTGVRPSDPGVTVTAEVLELSRIPSSTDVLATFEVELDEGGDIVGYSRIRRYSRNQVQHDEA